MAVIFRFFIQPAVDTLGPEIRKFSQAFNSCNRFSQFMGANTLLNILSGFVLFYQVSGGHRGIFYRWILHDQNLLPAPLRVGRTSRLVKLPNADPRKWRGIAEKTLHRYDTADLRLLAAAMLLMATACYWDF